MVIGIITTNCHIKLNMYQCDIPKLPTEISRNEFVENVFDIGRKNNHRYDTIIASVMLGDKFVSYEGKRIPYVELNNKTFSADSGSDDPDELLNETFDKINGNLQLKELIDNLVPQIYSLELACVVSLIVAKYNEDSGYRRIRYAITDTNNNYVIKMEWEICILIGFELHINNFITVICEIISKILNQNTFINGWNLSLFFWDFSKDICMNEKLLKSNPRTIILGSILLYKMGKLKAARLYKKRIFNEIMIKLAHEYELNLGDILRKYIAIKQNKITLTTDPTDLVERNKTTLIQIPSEIFNLSCRL